MKYDPIRYRFPSRRNMIFSKKGMVATSHPLAAQAGLAMLKKGGNAVDAAVAAAAALTVVEPTSNGIGGDNFALVWMNGKLHGLNASGRAPASLSLRALRDRGYDAVPPHGWIPVTVPGTPSGWAALSGRFGKLTFKDLLAPAAEYAREGHPVAPTVAFYWNSHFAEYKAQLKGEEFAPLFAMFAPDGRAPKAGESWRSEELARTLEIIADTKAEDFYKGELAERIGAFSKKHNGFLRKEDLAAYAPEWAEPIHTDYRGYTVWEMPPNGQGLTALMALAMLKGFEKPKGEDEALHRQIEAVKLALSDGKKYLADPHAMRVSPEQLLSEEYIARRRERITDEAATPEPGLPESGGTAYLAAADGEGNMVSMIQSNFIGFGSCVVIPGTGIALHSRGLGFSTDSSHPNALSPGKRPYHTIIPGFLTKGGLPVGPFGVTGGFMQPQGHVQMLTKAIDFGMNPQECLDAPRWQWVGDKKILVEPGFSRELIGYLQRRGHEIVTERDPYSFGRGQIVWRNEDGILCAGTEPRADGMVAAW